MYDQEDSWLEMSYYRYRNPKNIFERLDMEEKDIFDDIDDEEDDNAE